MMRWLLMVFFCVQASVAFGHARNNAFLDLTETAGTLSGTLQLRLEDLPLITGVDLDNNQQLTWGEVKLARGAVANYVTEHLQLGYENVACVLTPGEFQIQQMAGGSYLYIPLEVNCPTMSDKLEIGYSLLFASDAAHRGLMKIQSGDSSTVFVFAPHQQTFSVIHGEQAKLPFLLTFIEEGVWHIWTGYDHLLFLLALLIPLFIYRQPSTTNTPLTLKPAVFRVLKLITAFTIAHSITLIATSIYQPAFEPALIETLIAISVVLAGINIIVPMFDKGHWRIAFGFGLLHGLGFATALSGLELPADYFIECLLSFNLGVELGQLAIVLPCIPLLLILSRQFYYRTLAMPALALMVVSCSLWWTVQRAVQI